MFETWQADIGNGPRKGVVLKVHSSELGQILNCWRNIASEGIKRKIQNNKFGRKGGWHSTREVVMLKE